MKTKTISRPQKLHRWNKAYKSICHLYFSAFDKCIIYDKKINKFIVITYDFNAEGDEERYTDLLEITDGCKTIKALKRRIRRNLISMCGDFDINVRNFRYKSPKYVFRIKG